MAIEFYGGELTFTQEEDSCSHIPQQLTIGIDDAGGGKFFYLKTDRWSFDNSDELIALLGKVQKFIKEQEK